jgi:hypothetical protein
MVQKLLVWLEGTEQCIIQSCLLLTALVVGELYLGLIHVSCVMSHVSSFQRVQHIVGII